jgi:hypothetical protein
MAIKPMEAKCNILPLSNRLSEKMCLQMKTTELGFQKECSSGAGLYTYPHFRLSRVLPGAESACLFIEIWQPVSALSSCFYKEC